MNFASRNRLDSAAGGTFMEITLGEATKLLDNIMANYSQWHTERSSTSKKVHAIEEINTLSGKMDELIKLIASKSAPIDPSHMPLSTLIENNNECMDFNFVGRNNFGNNAYRGNFMEITLGEATKLLDNIMANYSQWHTERSSTSKKVHAIEEINTLSGKMDEHKIVC